MPSRVAIAASAFVIAVTVLVASRGHVARFSQAGPGTVEKVLSVLFILIAFLTVGEMVLGH